METKEFNDVGWFEIPVLNMDRAIAFYEAVLGIKLSKAPVMGNIEMALFPMNNGMGASGALCCAPEFYKPSTDGVRIYFTSRTGDLSNELARVEANGGRVVMPKTLISEEIGYFAVIMDTEGNCLSLHSIK